MGCGPKRSRPPNLVYLQHTRGEVFTPFGMTPLLPFFLLLDSTSEVTIRLRAKNPRLEFGHNWKVIIHKEKENFPNISLFSPQLSLSVSYIFFLPV